MTCGFLNAIDVHKHINDFICCDHLQSECDAASRRFFLFALELKMPTAPPTYRAVTGKCDLPLLLALVAAGLAGNHFKVPIFLDIEFLFGSIFALLALQFFGLGRGVLAAAIIAGYTYFLWNHPYAIVILTAEVAVVGWLMGRCRIGMVLADALYWLVIGMPLVYLCYHLAMEVPFSNTYIVMIKQAVNGIADALVARLIFTGYALRSRSSLTSYYEIVYNLLAFFVVGPVLIMIAVGSRTDFDETDRHVRTTLIQDSKQMTDRVETWVVNRKSAIVNLAEMAASRSPQQMQPYLEQAKKSDVNLRGVGLLDRDATITAFYPPRDELGQNNIGKNFAAYPFIPRLKRTRKPILSEAVVSKTGTPKPTVLMLAPVVLDGAYGGFAAGILGVEQIREHLDRSTGESASYYTLLDGNGNVIMSNRPDQKVMAPLERGKGTLGRLDETISQWVPTLPPNTPIMERWKQSYYVAETAIGDLAEWKLILEQSVGPFQKTLYDNYTGKFSLLFLIFLAALALAEILSRKTVVTLGKLRTLTDELPVRLATDGKGIAWPESGIKEAHQLIGNFREMADSLAAQFREVRQSNASLEQRVEERTDQLTKIMNELNIILENAPVGISKIIDGKQQWCNRETEELFLYSKKEMEYHSTRMLFPSDEAYQKLLQDAYPTLAQGLVLETMQELVRKDGVHLQIRCIGKAIEAPDLSKGILWLQEDITERMQVEEELRESELRYRTIADFTSDWEYWIMPDGTLRYISPSCEEVSGYSPGEFYTDPQLLTRIIHPDDLHLYAGHRHSMTAQGSPEPLDYRIRTKEGECRWISHVCRMVYDTAGQPLGQRASNRNITERKQSEEKIRKLNEELESRVRERTAELERLNKELEGFCYSISHEFRAPIARLEGFGGILLEIAQQDGKESIIHCARRIEAASQRLRAVIDSLLTMSRLSRADINYAPVNLSEISMKIVAELMEQAGDRTVEFKIAPDIVVNGDRYMLDICMRNLLGNAFKYTSNTVAASIEFGKLSSEEVGTYYVKDNGVGFDMEYAKTLFVPFSRLHNESEFEGSGVGLAIVHRIIEKHKGRIWAEAVPGKGATFYFTLGFPEGTKERALETSSA